MTIARAKLTSRWWLCALAALPLACTAKTTAPVDVAPVAEDAAAIDLAAARQMVGQIELFVINEKSACTPKTIGDVESILKLDQASLFGPGVVCAQKFEGREADALEAQIQLAWGESYSTLLEIMLLLGESYDERGMELVDKDNPTTEEEKELVWLREERARTERFADAFQLLSIDHATIGSALADEVIHKYPDSYLGYRVAADYHRMTRDWSKFDQMLTKIEELNPESNGLVFQKGAAAWQRGGDRQEAQRYLRQALERDEEFVRAQAHLVAIQEEIPALYAEYKKLQDMNPDHQLIEWAGKGIEWAWGWHRPTP